MLRLKTKKIHYTESEKKWLKNNPINKIAIMSYWPHDENRDSLHTEVLKLINKYAGTNLIPIEFNTWSDGFEKASLGDEIVGIMGLSWSKHREEKFFYYTSAYDFTPSYLLTKKENHSIRSLKDLNNKTILLKENSITHKLVQDNITNAKIIDKKTIQDMYHELSNNQNTDAIVSYFIDKSQLNKYPNKHRI